MVPPLSVGTDSRSIKLHKYQERESESSFGDDFNVGISESLDLSFSKFSHVSGISVSKSRTNGSRGSSESGSPFVEKMHMRIHNMEVERAPRPKMEPISENSDRSSSPSSPLVNSLNLPKVRHTNPKHRRRAQELPSTPVDENAPQFHRKFSEKMSLTPAQRVEKVPGLKHRNALDNFRFFEKVGRGAYADVYRGVNIKTNQVVAIKQISLDKDHDLLVLMGEIDLLKILKHENIVKYHGFVKTHTSLNVILEYCSGGSLRQLYKKLGHGLQEQEMISYVRPILQGLNYLHEQGVVHRDVKAANVLITDSGKVKLADFGVATKVATLHNTIVGTPNWMAPESVLGGEGICTASDIWSLGATIIELFTTYPPYHDLNPMAALHAIGTDEHPPLPSGMAPLAKDFLLECFQRQPSIRISAKLLLKHKWMAQELEHLTKMTKSESVRKSLLDPQLKLLSSTPKLESDSATPYTVLREHTSTSGTEQSLSSSPRKKYTRSELLSKFTDKEDDLGIDGEGESDLINIKLVEKKDESLGSQDEEYSDPFLELDIENFDTNDLEVQSKMEFLITKLNNRVSSAHLGNDEITQSLVKITGRMLQLLKKYPTLHDVIIRDHSVLTFMELLESAPELIEEHKLWYHVLSILNVIFGDHVAQLENFALLGGIPMITQFSKLSFGLPVRLQVVKFVKILKKSDKAMLMFVSSGGLRVLSRFLEEDFDLTPDFPLVAINCIHEILDKDLTRFKSDMCRVLSKYGVLFWFVVLLNRLARYSPSSTSVVPQEYVEVTIDKILEVMKFFGQSEPRVRISISNPDLFKLLIKVYPSVNFSRQLTILRFFRSITCISGLLRPLYSADILEFYVNILLQFTPSTPRYKEVVNIVCPSLYNCCSLNHNKEAEIVRLGAVPLLRDLSKINLLFRQFVLPLICEFVYCDSYVRLVLIRHDILNTFFNLLVDPYWHYNALESLLHWGTEDANFRWLDSAKAKDCLISGFMMSKISNMEAALDNYLTLVTSNKSVLHLMTRDSVILSILSKLTVYGKNPAAKLSLLRILRCIIDFAVSSDSRHDISSLGKVRDSMNLILSAGPSVLVQELATKIEVTIDSSCTHHSLTEERKCGEPQV